MNLDSQYKTYIMADAPFRMRPSDLSQFSIRDPLGNMVPLSTLAIVADTVGPLYTNRFNFTGQPKFPAHQRPDIRRHRLWMPWGKLQKNLYQKEWGSHIVICLSRKKLPRARVDLYL